MIDYKFSDDFIFGTAVASYQVEGGIYNNDWTHWENKVNTVCAEPCNEACKHYEYLEDDINLLEKLGIKAFRFSMEWSRIQPEENIFNEEEIEYYVEKAKQLLSKNITPIITFHHFTSPDWLAKYGYCASSKTAKARGDRYKGSGIVVNSVKFNSEFYCLATLDIDLLDSEITLNNKYGPILQINNYE